EIDSQHDAVAFFVRAYLYLTVIIPALPAHLRTFDIAQMFQAKYCFPLAEYCQFIFMFVLHAMTVREKHSLLVALDSGIRIDSFKNTTVPADSIERMFRAVSFTSDDIVTGKAEIGFADFDFL